LTLLHTGLLTALSSRHRTYGTLAELLRGIQKLVPGHTAVYFSSFAYLQAVAAKLGTGFPMLVQQPEMSQKERRELLLRLQGARSPRLLLGVIGGSLAESVDFPPGLVRVVVVVGPGLPALSVENELLRYHYTENEEDGFLLAYLLPGMSAVLQAAGRLIRRETDRGVLLLVGGRFRSERFWPLLPAEYRETLRICGNNGEVLREIENWEGRQA
jgi:Rad3-related DNA helicase